MIHKHLVSVSEDGQMVWHMHDDMTGQTAFYTEMDAQPIIDANTEQKKTESGNWKGDLHHVARVDPVTWAAWTKEFGGNPMAPENRGRLMMKLNDRDYSKFRVKSGRL